MYTFRRNLNKRGVPDSYFKHEYMLPEFLLPTQTEYEVDWKEELAAIEAEHKIFKERVLPRVNYDKTMKEMLSTLPRAWPAEPITAPPAEYYY